MKENNNYQLVFDLDQTLLSSEDLKSFNLYSDISLKKHLELNPNAMVFGDKIYYLRPYAVELFNFLLENRIGYYIVTASKGNRFKVLLELFKQQTDYVDYSIIYDWFKNFCLGYINSDLYKDMDRLGIENAYVIDDSIDFIKNAKMKYPIPPMVGTGEDDEELSKLLFHLERNCREYKFMTIDGNYKSPFYY